MFLMNGGWSQECLLKDDGEISSQGFFGQIQKETNSYKPTTVEWTPSH